MHFEKGKHLLVAGIGNPDMPRSRHSLGLYLIERVRRHYEFPEWDRDAKRKGSWSTFGMLHLFKSHTMMNTSGSAVARAFRMKGGVRWGKLAVIHDEMQLPVAQPKYYQGGSHKLHRPQWKHLSNRGHKGIAHVIERLYSDDFIRFSIGIGRPDTRNTEIIRDFVLADVPPEDLQRIDEEAFPWIINEIETLIEVKRPSQNKPKGISADKAATEEQPPPPGEETPTGEEKPPGADELH